MTSTYQGAGIGSERFSDLPDELEDHASRSVIPGFGAVRTVTLLSTSLFCATLAWIGGATLFYLLLSKYFSPAAAHYSRNLYFDYTKPEAVATAHFLPDAQYIKAISSTEAAARARFLDPRQRFDIWLELATPEHHGAEGDEVFQVLGELVTGDGRIAATASRPCLVKQRYWVSRTFRLWWNFPFVILGLWDERQEVKVPLFQNYREQAAAPFVVFRATMLARAGGGRLPQVYEAKVHLRLHLGLLTRLFYLTRLGSWLNWLVIAAALLSVGFGTAGSIAAFVLWWVTGSSSPPAVCKQPSGFEEDDVSEEEGEDDLASQADIDGSVSEYEQENLRLRKHVQKGSFGAKFADDASQATYDSRESASAQASGDLPGRWPDKKLP